MGPTDPFASPPAPHAPAAKSPASVMSRTEPPAPRGGPTRAPLAGLAAGLGFGLVWVWLGLGAALTVLICGAVGAGLTWLGALALGGGLDLSGAWNALFRR